MAATNISSAEISSAQISPASLQKTHANDGDKISPMQLAHGLDLEIDAKAPYNHIMQQENTPQLCKT